MRFVVTLTVMLLLASLAYAKPNVIIFMADDYGADACFPYGCDTNVAPSIDSLATDGMMFLDFTASSSCSPTRAMLMTGRLSDKNGVPAVVLSNLSTNEVAFSRLARDVGYETGIVGKWNLYTASRANLEGIANQNQQLTIHGFDFEDTFIGTTIDYGDSSTQETYTPYQYNQSALGFIEDNSSNQFFLVYNFGLVHEPYGSTPLDPAFTGTDTDYFWEMVEYMDWAVSNVLDKIQSEGIYSNTVVIFLGDNGTDDLVTLSFDGSPTEGAKLTPDESGAWVPFYLRWPGVVDAGSTNVSKWGVQDISITLADVMGFRMPSDRLIDGRSFYQSLTTNQIPRREFVMTSYQGSNGFCKDGTRKLIDNLDGSYTLYDITQKPFGDIEVTNKTHLDRSIELKLENVYTNVLQSSFGDRPWSGSANEFILSEGL